MTRNEIKEECAALEQHISNAREKLRKGQAELSKIQMNVCKHPEKYKNGDGETICVDCRLFIYYGDYAE